MGIIVPLCCSGQEYDIYGFVKKYDYESGEFDPVTLEAQKLERRSTEVNDKVKVKPSTLNTVLRHGSHQHTGNHEFTLAHLN